MMQASVRTQPGFAVGDVRQLFTGPFVLGAIYPNYDVGRDGRSFVMVRPDQTGGQTIMVVRNWFANLARSGGREGGAVSDATDGGQPREFGP